MFHQLRWLSKKLNFEVFVKHKIQNLINKEDEGEKINRRKKNFKNPGKNKRVGKRLSLTTEYTQFLRDCKRPP